MTASWRAVCALLAAVLAASSCRTESYAPGSDAAIRELRIKAGDEIRVVTTRRERLAFNVTGIRADRFVGITVQPWHKELRPAGE